MDDDALYERLKEALVEARNLRHEAYEETRRRQKADRDLAHASRMVVLTCFDRSNVVYISMAWF